MFGSAGVPGVAGVVLLHDRYGGLPHLGHYAGQLRREGFAVEVPDLYGGRSTTDPAEAERLLGLLDQAAVDRAVDDAVAGLAEAGPVGLVGFSTGGRAALRAAARGARVAAVVAYDAALAPDAAVAVPTLVHAAGRGDGEAFAPPGRSAAGRREPGVEATVLVHPGTAPGFANADVAAYADVAALAAWNETVAFLRRHLVPTAVRP